MVKGVEIHNWMEILVTVLFFIWRLRGLIDFPLFLVKVIFFLIIFFGLFFMINDGYMYNIINKFYDAFTVVFSGNTTDDPSANARLFEFALAQPYIIKNWIFGNGDISNQWNGGYKNILGYFYPEDIGIIGVIYIYGVLGTILFALQFYFAYRFSSFASKNIFDSSFFDATKGYVFYLAIYSFATGYFAHNLEVSFFFVALIYCFSLESTKDIYSIESQSQINF